MQEKLKAKFNIELENLTHNQILKILNVKSSEYQNFKGPNGFYKLPVKVKGRGKKQSVTFEDLMYLSMGRDMSYMGFKHTFIRKILKNIKYDFKKPENEEDNAFSPMLGWLKTSRIEIPDHLDDKLTCSFFLHRYNEILIKRIKHETM